jgi:16S rRNA (adenine1518-N6/adenine1519-N6)-dimethyltransferase
LENQDRSRFVGPSSRGAKPGTVDGSGRLTIPAARRVTSPRQTQSFLSRRFEHVGIRPRRRLGQNFLIDLNLLQLLADAADVRPGDVVLEVGAGTGSLTALLAARAAFVVAVEIDPGLQALFEASLAGVSNVCLLKDDALAGKNRLNPRLVDEVSRRLADARDRRLLLAANLPFNVATPVLCNLLASEIVPAAMTVTIQKELADRIVARPGTRDYGATSVWIQSQCEVSVVRVIPPTAFWPRPKVSSAIVRAVIRPELRNRIHDLRFFHDFIRALFLHRRKFLRGSLLGAFKGRLDKPRLDAVLRDSGFDPTARAEVLDVDEMLRLSEALFRAIQTG